MARKRLRGVRIEIDMMLPSEEWKAEEAIQQLRDFLEDRLAIDDEELEWAPFDIGAYTIELIEEHLDAYIDEKQPIYPDKVLAEGSA